MFADDKQRKDFAEKMILSIAKEFLEGGDHSDDSGDDFF